MNAQSPRNSGAIMKCLGALVVGLLLSAIIGGVVLSQQVAAMSAKIEALTSAVQGMNARVLYLERAVRLANRARDD